MSSDIIDLWGTKVKTKMESTCILSRCVYCDWGCPCQFNAKPTHGNCDGVAGYHIVSGIYGTNVKLDGLNMALIASWPGPIHEGHGTASFYIDNRPFEVCASTIEKLQEPRKAGVKF